MSHYILSMLYRSQVGCIPRQYAVSKTRKYAFLAEASSLPVGIEHLSIFKCGSD